ncbi:MAG: response regulator transcription factor [Candidatus Binatia bacterium]
MAVRAIIVDDFATDRQYIKYYLVKFGCVVVGEAANAADGLKLFRTLTPDIVTMDLLMPNAENIDPITAIGAIREEEPETAVVVVSTLGSQLHIAECLDNGIFDYVIKPVNQFSFDQLERSLRRRFPELRSLRRLNI